MQESMLAECDRQHHKRWLASAALLVSVAATTQLFWDAEPAAGKLLLPYFAWTAYATVLNGWIWNKNPKVCLYTFS